jgi:hypothetical protein
MIVDNHPDPYMALYYMRLRASRYGCYPTEIETSENGCYTQQLTDGSTIQLTLDAESGTWMLARFFHENGQKIILYQEHGEYVEDDEDTGEYIP